MAHHKIKTKNSLGICVHSKIKIANFGITKVKNDSKTKHNNAMEEIHPADKIVGADDANAVMCLIINQTKLNYSVLRTCAASDNYGTLYIPAIVFHVQWMLDSK